MTAPRELLDYLAERDFTPHSCISLYLDARPNERGRDDFGRFVRRAFKVAGERYPARTPRREAYERTIARLRQYLENQVRPEANGIAIYASTDGQVFESLQIEAPFLYHALVVGPWPYVHPLARVIDHCGACLVVVADTHFARLFILDLGAVAAEAAVESPKVPRPAMGGWSQFRHQRRADEFHLHHAKAVAAAADRLVRKHAVRHLILAGDAVALPLVRRVLPPRLARLEIAALPVDIQAAGHEVLERAKEVFGRHRDLRDRALVNALLDTTLSRDQATIGVKPTLKALDLGQVDELVITASVDHFTPGPPKSLVDQWQQMSVQLSEPRGHDAEQTALFANEFVLRARRTHAGVTFIGDPALLAEVGHVGARLRFPSAGERRVAPVARASRKGVSLG